jgi:hypothetical protein
MKLQNDIELENTRRKLSRLRQLISQKERAAHSAGHDISVESMKAMAEKLVAEIHEYERTHQTA